MAESGDSFRPEAPILASIRKSLDASSPVQSPAVRAAMKAAMGPSPAIREAMQAASNPPAVLTNSLNSAALGQRASIATKVWEQVDRAKLASFGINASPLAGPLDLMKASAAIGSIAVPNLDHLGLSGRPSMAMRIATGDLPAAIKAVISPFSSSPFNGLLGFGGAFDPTPGFVTGGYDSTAYVSQLQRAIGLTDTLAFQRAARAFYAPPFPAVSAPFVIPVPDADPVREVFEAFGIELAETDVAARAAFANGYLWACECRYSTAGRLVAWAIGVLGASVAFYGYLSQSEAVGVAGALGVLVAFMNFPDLRPDA